jgi:hypothetical protein
MARQRIPRAGVVAAGLLLLAAGGCGPRLYPVRGSVTYPDGRPVTEGLVVFESDGPAKAVTARGDIHPDGRYELSTFRPGDGVPPGTYHVLVAPKSDPNAVDRPPKPPAFDPRFAAFATSGLEVEVAAGTADYPLHVAPAGKPSR